jgi:hypothetical protein
MVSRPDKLSLTWRDWLRNKEVLTWIVDARTDLGPVGDQGVRPTCLSWAMTAAHEFNLNIGELSVEYLHWGSGNRPGGRGSVRGADESLRSDGQPPESQWPHLTACDEGSPAYQPPASVTGPFQRASVQIVGIDVDSIVATINSGSVPVIAMRVTDAFLAASGGVVFPDGPGNDGHAVVAAGVAQYNGTQSIGSLQAGERLVCVRNSWSSSWGVDGYALLTESALAQCGLGAFTITPGSAVAAP